MGLGEVFHSYSIPCIINGVCRQWFMRQVFSVFYERIRHLHGDTKKLMLGCGDDDIGAVEDFEVVLFTGHVAPVMDTVFQICLGLGEDICWKVWPHE